MGDPFPVPARRAAWLSVVGRRARSPVGVGVLGKAAEAATLVALTLLVPRALGAADFGTFSVALSIVTIATSAMAVGGSALLGRFVPAAGADERRPLARAIVERLLPARALQAAGVVASAALVAVMAPGWVGALGILFVGLAVVLEIAAALAYQVALGLGHTALWSFRYPLQNTVLCVVALALYAWVGIDGAIAGIVAASATAALLGTVVASRELRGARRGAEIPEGAIRFGMLHGLGGLLAQLSYRGAPIAAALLGASQVEVGYAALAAGIAVAVVYAVWQAFVVDLPHLSSLARDRPQAAEARMRRLATAATLLLVPVAILGTAGAGWALPIVLGEDFADAAPAFGPALAVLPLAASAALVTQASTLRLRAEIRVTSTIAGAGAFVATSLVAVPAIGAPGATLALLASVATTVATGAFALRDAHGRRLLALAYAGAAVTLAVGLA